MLIGKNTTVSIDYSLNDEKGNLLEDTKESGPVAYLHGAGFMIPALEEALEGKKEGVELTVNLTAEEAYGPREESLVLKLPRNDFEDADTIEVGEQVQIHDGDEGGVMTVVEVDDELVTLDGNHPFAGLGLSFAIAVRGVRETTQDDIDAVNHHHHHHDCGCGDDCGCEEGGCGDQGCGEEGHGHNHGGGCCGGH